MPTQMNITVIIFDMDGVLIDSEPAHKLAKERAFARFGITLPEALYEQYKGRPDETMMSEVVPTPRSENRRPGNAPKKASGI